MAHWSEKAQQSANASMSDSPPDDPVKSCPTKDWETLAEIPDGPDWETKVEIEELPDEETPAEHNDVATQHTTGGDVPKP